MSEIKDATSIGPSKGSNIDIDIDFDETGALDSVEVDGQMLPLENGGEAGAGTGNATSQGASPDTDTNLENISESFNRLLDASAEVWTNFLEYLPYLMLALALLLLTVFVASWTKAGAHKLLMRSGMRYSLGEVLSRFVYVLVWIAAALLIAKLLFPGFEFGKAVTYLGVASLVVGFVLRDIFENAFAGLLILWRFPFEIGDYIEIESDPPVCGQVHDIWVRSTLIREVSDELVVVPNAKVYQHAVRVTTWRQNNRQTFSTLVAYDTELEKAKEVIADAIRGCQRVAENPPVMVFTRRFADSGVELQAAWWAESGPLEELRSTDEVALAVRKALHEADIEIPFPYRTLTFKPEYPLHASAQQKEQDEDKT